MNDHTFPNEPKEGSVTWLPTREGDSNPKGHESDPGPAYHPVVATVPGSTLGTSRKVDTVRLEIVGAALVWAAIIGGMLLMR